MKIKKSLGLLTVAMAVFFGVSAGITNAQVNGATATVIGNPTIELKYDAARKESSLVGTIDVSIQAGFSDLWLYTSMAYATLVNQKGQNAPANLQFDIASGEESDQYGRRYIRVLAGQTVRGKIILTANPKQLFAGTYRSILMELYTKGSDDNIVSIQVPQTYRSDDKTIIGEVSPYISSATPNTIAPGQKMSLQGVRLIGALGQGNLYIDSLASTAVLDGSKDGNLLFFTMPALTNGYHTLSVRDNLNGTGASNNVSFQVSSSQPCYSFTTNLRQGDRNADVAKLQTFLLSKGFGIGDLTVSSNSDKGFFGRLTFVALRDYQTSVGLPANGIFGPETRQRVNSDCNQIPTPVVCPAGYTCTPGIPTTPQIVNCPAGFVCTQNSPIVSCPVGYVCTPGTPTTPQVTNCPAGFICSPYVLTEPKPVTCPPGYVCNSVPPTSVTPSCPVGYNCNTTPTVLSGPITNPANGHRYYLLSPSDFRSAEAVAVSLGGHLITVNDQAENTWMMNTFSRYGGTARVLWLGLNDMQSEGIFQWTSGERSSYTNWTPGEPNNGMGIYAQEDAVHTWSPDQSYPQGSWNDSQSSLIYYGVVEVGDTVNPTQPSITVTSPNGGESLNSGDIITIKWNKNNSTASKVDIWLLDDPTRYGSVILSSTPNDGSESWVVKPLTQITSKEGLSVAPSGKYVVFISCSDNSCIVDDSNSYFKINSNPIPPPPPPTSSITINKTSIKTSYNVGDVFPISWTSSGVSKVNINLMDYKGLKVIRSLATNQPASGQFNWPVSGIDFNNDNVYVISVSDAKDASVKSVTGKITFNPTAIPTPPVLPTTQTITVLPWTASTTANSGSTKAGNYLFYTLNWSGGPMADPNYMIFVHFVNRSTGATFAADFYPSTPVSSWSGSISTPNNTLVPAGVAPGTYDVYVGIYRGGTRLALNAGPGVVAENDGGLSKRYKVGSIEVTAGANVVTGASSSGMPYPPTSNASANIWDAIKSWFTNR